jgi:hypothetical protein
MTADIARIFILSPADCGGERARLMRNPNAGFDLAERVRSPGGAPLGEVFSFLSGLYFRGKLAYARAFVRPPRGAAGITVVTASDGLRTPDQLITLADIERYATVPIALNEARYRGPLARDAHHLAQQLGPECEVVLLGSIATRKYTDVLSDAFADRLRFPREFIGRGDMSRGALLLRCVREARELSYDVPQFIGAGAPKNTLVDVC